MLLSTHLFAAEDDSYSNFSIPKGFELNTLPSGTQIQRKPREFIELPEGAKILPKENTPLSQSNKQIDKELLVTNNPPQYVTLSEDAISEKILNYLRLIDAFLKKEESNQKYEKYITSLQTLQNDCSSIHSKYGNHPCNEKEVNLVNEKLKKASELKFSKYRDYVFCKYGFCINSNYGGFHSLFLQIEKKDHWINSMFKEDTLSVRYKIVPDIDLPCYTNLTNMSIVFLNEDRFEIFRFFVGDLKEECVSTGKFEIPETIYKELRFVKAITDQDRGTNVFWIGINARSSDPV